MACMAVHELAQEIKNSVDQRVADHAGPVSEEGRLEFEADVRREALLQICCHELWVQNGRQLPADFNQYLPQAGPAMYRTKQGMHYRTDGKVNTKEALGFLKDWSTSLIQLDSAAIAAIGLFVGFSDFTRSPILGIGDLHDWAWGIAILEVSCIVLSALSFFISLAFGLFLLNALPGAAQRVPADVNAMGNDVFSIANIGPKPSADQGWIYRRFPQPRTINELSHWLRVWFLSGAGLFAASIGFGLLRVALSGRSCLLD